MSQRLSQDDSLGLLACSNMPISTITASSVGVGVVLFMLGGNSGVKKVGQKLLH